jgi:hypothetical protein
MLCTFNSLNRLQSHVVHVHNVSGEKKTADNLLSLVLKAMLHLHNTGVTIVGWVSDAGGDSRAMRLKLSELMPHLIVLDCWAHQVCLLLNKIHPANYWLD